MNIINESVTTKVKNQRSHKEWQEIIRKFHDSDLSKSKFCRQKGIGKTSLYYWLNEYKDTGLSADKSEMSFAKVITKATSDEVVEITKKGYADSEEDYEDIQISLPSGINIKLPISYDVILLVTIIRELESC